MDNIEGLQQSTKLIKSKAIKKNPPINKSKRRTINKTPSTSKAKQIQTKLVVATCVNQEIEVNDEEEVKRAASAYHQQIHQEFKAKCTCLFKEILHKFCKWHEEIKTAKTQVI